MSKNTNVSDFEGFLNYVKENIKAYINEGSDCSVQIIPMVKNNQVIMEGLQISNMQKNHAPVIYLENFYEIFSMGTDLSEVMEAIAHVYEESKTVKGYIEPEKITNFVEMKDRIILRLVNREMNKDMLVHCPHRLMNDLAVTYRVLAGKNEDGISTFLVSNELMNEWDVDEAQLYALACENSLCLFPPVIEKIHEMMQNSFGIEWSRLHPGGYEMYILTNDIKINGASAVCYSDALEWFAKKMKSDFYIIPSSIHEMLLLTVDADIDPKHIQSVIHDVNRSVVLEEEILSDNLYFYSLKDRKMRKYYAS